ncbi:hypothetical protein Tco_0195881 [Tanacetum coccineum]
MVAFLKKPTETIGFTKIVDFLKGTSLRYALTHNSTIYDSLVKQFWQTATVRTLTNGIEELVATIDNKEYTITKASIRSAASDQEPPHSSPPRKIDRQEIKVTTTGVGVETKGATTTTSSFDAGLDSELMAIIPKLVTRIDSLEKELKETKQTLGNVVLTLVKKVKSLEVDLKRKIKKVVLSASEDEETENHGRNIQDIDDDPLVSLVRDSMEEKEADFVTVGSFY